MRRNPEVSMAAILCGLLVLACTKSASTRADSTAAMTASTEFNADAERKAVRNGDELWQRAVRSKNIDSLMTIYAPDAVSSNGGAPAAKGKDAVRSAYAAFLKTNPNDVSVKIENVDFSADGNLAIDRGSYSGTADGSGGKRVKFAGDYLAVWKKADGRWLIIDEMANSTLPQK